MKTPRSERSKLREDTGKLKGTEPILAGEGAIRVVQPVSGWESDLVRS